MTERTEASKQDYADGMADGLADLPPNVERLALGANRLNAYERGYIDSGDAKRVEQFRSRRCLNRG